MKRAKVTAILGSLFAAGRRLNDELRIDLESDASPMGSCDDLTDDARLRLTNTSGALIRNVVLYPIATSGFVVLSERFSFGSLVDGDSAVCKARLRWLSHGDDVESVGLWQIDFDDVSGNHHRLMLSLEPHRTRPPRPG